jgi:uncharacterized protein
MGPSLSAEDGNALLRVAEEAIRAVFERRSEVVAEDLSPHLHEPGASFVTLELAGALAGCIGSIEPVRPLVEDVAHNATGAAFADPRLPVLRADQLETVSIKVSVLGTLEPIPAHDRAVLESTLRPDYDGLVIQVGGQRATFLPSVWTHLGGAGAFLDQLLRKAGVSGARWPRGMQAWRYQTAEFSDHGPRAPVALRAR